MFSNLFVPLAALIAIASAAPTPQTVPISSVDYTTTDQPTVRLAGSPLDGKLINAANGGFFIGKEPTTTCDLFKAPCGYFKNQTTITFSQSLRTGNLSVFTAGGAQSVYVAPTGELAYTAPGAAAPEGAVSNDFRRWENFPPSGAIYATIGFRGAQWFACPTEEADAYQVLAAAFASGTGCTAFEMNPNEVTISFPSAYEYTV